MAVGGAQSAMMSLLKTLVALGVAQKKVTAQFLMAVGPINAATNALRQFAGVADLSLTSGASVRALQSVGAAVTALGGDINDAGSLFSKLDAWLLDLKMGGSGGNLNNIAIRYGLVFDNTNTPEERLNKINAKMNDLKFNPALQRGLQRELGLSDAMFRLVTKDTKEFQRIIAENNKFTLFPKNKYGGESNKLTEEATQRALKFRTACNHLNQAFEKWKYLLSDLLTLLAPFIEQLAATLAYLADSKVALYSVAAILTLISAISAVKLVRALFSLSRTLSAITHVFLSFTNASGKASKGMGLMAQFTAKAGRSFTILKNGFRAFQSSGFLGIFRWISGAAATRGHGVIAKIFAVPDRAVGFLKSIPKMISSLGTSIKGISFSRMFSGLKSIPGKSLNGFKKFGIGLYHIITGGFIKAWNGIKYIFNLRSLFSSASKGLAGLMKSGVMKVIGGSILSAFMFAVDGMTVGCRAVFKFFTEGWDTCKAFFLDTIPGMFHSFSEFGATIRGLFEGFWEGLGTGISDVIDQFIGWALPQSWSDALRTMLEGFFGFIGKIPGAIIDAICSPIETVKDAWKGVKGFFGFGNDDKDSVANKINTAGANLAQANRAAAGSSQMEMATRTNQNTTNSSVNSNVKMEGGIHIHTTANTIKGIADAGQEGIEQQVSRMLCFGYPSMA